MNESTSKYIGIYNYMKNELPITKMVSFGDDIDTVKNDIKEQAKSTNTLLSDYHISEYSCVWDVSDDSLPTKVQQFTLS